MVENVNCKTKKLTNEGEIKINWSEMKQLIKIFYIKQIFAKTELSRLEKVSLQQ